MRPDVFSIFFPLTWQILSHPPSSADQLVCICFACVSAKVLTHPENTLRWQRDQPIISGISTRDKTKRQTVGRLFKLGWSFWATVLECRVLVILSDSCSSSRGQSHFNEPLHTRIHPNLSVLALLITTNQRTSRRVILSLLSITLALNYTQ